MGPGLVAVRWASRGCTHTRALPLERCVQFCPWPFSHCPPLVCTHRSSIKGAPWASVLLVLSRTANVCCGDVRALCMCLRVVRGRASVVFLRTGRATGALPHVGAETCDL
eukprot:6510333-Alexandrium_andersonii.AAC.1